MSFQSSITGLDSEVSEEGKLKELANHVKHILQLMEDAAETQWSSSGLTMGKNMKREGLHFSVTRAGNLNSSPINSVLRPLTKVENKQDITWKNSILIPCILGTGIS